MEPQTHQARRPNRLIKEKSPYLLEHAYNPVDWYPWGDEAFQKARVEDKPIFLSIGYSACHWCHVFRRESLEDEDIAKILNENFVSIKVDREERPDVDEIYMKAVTSMTGSGGWPLNVFLTPKLEPFYGGTYFPPASRYGMPGFVSVLNGVINAWRTEKEQIIQSASQMTLAVNESFKSSSQNKPTPLDKEIFDSCFSELASAFDQQYGGFGSAPKFPTPSNLFFLLRYFHDNNAKAPLSMVTKTLDCMANGGIYDQIGGGFHRYSTDREWLVPHFEKMLYDNALLSLVYTEAFLVTKNDTYKKIIEETHGWVLREMIARNGGFFSAIDADSPEGEGSYYVWSKKEVLDALSEKAAAAPQKLEQEAKIVLKYYGVTEDGNFENGKTILTSSRLRFDRICSEYSLSQESLLEIIKRAKDAMREFRDKRPRPRIDDKILTGWNGLMISAMSKAYQAFGNQEFLDAARNCARFILGNLALKENGQFAGLIHRFREGEAKGTGLLEDYAYFVNGLLDLYESSFDSYYLKSAIELARVMIKEFFDEKSGGFFLTTEGSNDLIARPKVGFDGAIPSANSLATFVLFRLSEMTVNEDFRNKAESVFRAFSQSIEQQPSAFAFMLAALYYELSEPREIVFSGGSGSSDFNSMLRTVRSLYLPNCVVLLADESVQDLTPLAEARIPSPGQQAKAFVCKGSICKLPSTNENELLLAISS